MSNVSAKHNNLILRSRLLKLIRDFFYVNDFIEVNTPIMVKTPALEDHIDAIRSGNGYLRTSPELHMKRLLQSDCDRIFQIGSCFRKGEKGRLHNPEFTMLEWYIVGFDYLDILEMITELIRYIFSELVNGMQLRYLDQTLDVGGAWDKLTVESGFLSFTDTTVSEALKNGQFEARLVHNIESGFSSTKPTVLMDFPIELGAMARASQNNSAIAERWELYLGGLEIANAYSELIDPEEQLIRFKRTAEFREKSNLEVYPIDKEFIQALENGIPECAGCALGLDRLLMILSNRKSIDEVITFH